MMEWYGRYTYSIDLFLREPLNRPFSEKFALYSGGYSRCAVSFVLE